MIDLATMPFGNGGGSVKRLTEVMDACKTPMTEIEVGSITMERRDGNVGDTYYFHPSDLWSLNALGLPNLGSQYYLNNLSEMVRHAHGAGKKLRANIAPFSPQECGHLAAMCFERGVDSVVINGSCPNIWDGGKRKALPALDPDGADALLDATKYHVGDLKRVWFKLAPTDDMLLVSDLVKVFRSYSLTKLVCCNTKGGQRGVREDGKPALAFRAANDFTLQHEGGLAGSAIFKENITTASAFIEEMPEAEVIGLGGIFGGVDAEQYLKIGCVGVQTTTGYLQFGGKIFSEMLEYLSDKIAA